MLARDITLAEALSLNSFYHRFPMSEVKAAIEAGRKVELAETTFKDPGEDRCEIRIDDEVVFTAKGY